MSYIKQKDAVALAYAGNVTRLRAEGRIILDALMNEALAEMTSEFQGALSRGQILEIGGSRDEMREFLRVAAARELGSIEAGVA